MTTESASSGARLRAMVAADTDPRTAVLLLEAARIADRLDQIDAIVTGKTQFIELMHFRTRNDNEQEVTVTIDGVLAEARQQGMALRAILAQLDVPKAVAATSKARSAGDELRARRAAREASRVTEPEGAASS